MKYFKSNHQIQTDMRYQCLNITLNRDGSLSKKFSFSFFSETYKVTFYACHCEFPTEILENYTRIWGMSRSVIIHLLHFTFCFMYITWNIFL